MAEFTHVFQDLFQELLQYERRGVTMAMDGEPASPMQIVTAHMLRENKDYMRDYVWNDKGDLKELCFYMLKNN